MTKKSVLSQLAALKGMTRPELQERWRELFQSEPPGYSREMLAARLAYRVQELAYGGLSDATRERMRELVPEGSLDTDADAIARMKRRSKRDGVPVVGTRLIREWQGTRHEVVVVQGGFEHEGRVFRSLSAVARHITGTSWNGWRFFGLRKPGKATGS